MMTFFQGRGVSFVIFLLLLSPETVVTLPHNFLVLKEDVFIGESAVLLTLWMS